MKGEGDKIVLELGAGSVVDNWHWDRIMHNLITGIQVISFGIIILSVIYYILKCMYSYRTAKGYEISMICSNNANYDPHIRVGETISMKLKFSKTHDNRQEKACTPTELVTINNNLILKFFQGNEQVNVAILKTFTQKKDALIIRFSLRKAGPYEIRCLYWRFNFVGSPLPLDVHPGPICPRSMVLQVENSETIPVIVDEWTLIPITPHDRYDNVCQIGDELVEHFEIVVKLNDSFAQSPEELDWDFARKGSDFILKLKTSKCSIYKCKMNFMKKPIEMNQSSSTFTVISMSSSEEEIYRSSFGGYFSSYPASTKALLLDVGSKRQDMSMVYISVTNNHVSFSYLILGMVHYAFLAFSINRRTKMSCTGPYDFDDDENEPRVCLKISDGIQDSVTFAMKSSQARILLATFGHFKACKLKRSSFVDKKSVLAAELGGNYPKMLKGAYVMALDKNEILASSMNKSPTKPTDWMRPFVIGLIVDNPPAIQSANLSSICSRWYRSTPVTKPFPVDKWLITLIESLLNNQDGTGLFIRNPGSLRLHPNLASRRTPL